MNDPEMEDVLRRYRPVGPPPQLRARMLASTRVPRTWPWAAAAAVLLISMLTLRISARSATASVDLRLGSSATDRRVEELSRMFGGTPESRELAESIVIEERLRAQTAAAMAPEDVTGDRP